MPGGSTTTPATPRPHVPAEAYVVCDTCGEFVAFNPRDVRSWLAEGVGGPRCLRCEALRRP